MRIIIFIGVFFVSLSCSYSTPALERESDDELELLERFSSKQSCSITPTFKLRFNLELSEEILSDEFIILVADDIEGPCSVDLDCNDDALCVESCCQRSVVDAAFLADFRRYPLSQKRKERLIELSYQLSGDYKSILLTPKVPLDEKRQYRIIISDRVVSRDGYFLRRVKVLPFLTTSRESSRPIAELLSPEPMQTNIDRNLNRILIRFSRDVRRKENKAIRLRNTQGEYMLLSARSADGVCPARSGFFRCLILTPQNIFKPLTTWSVVFPDDIVDESSQTLFNRELSGFAFGEHFDFEDPYLEGTAFSFADHCLLVDAKASEAVDLKISSSKGETIWAIDESFFRLGIPISLPYYASLELFISDRCGNSIIENDHYVQRDVNEKLVISEIMVNPKGHEPDQEYIELYNWGDDLFIRGWSLMIGDKKRVELPDVLIPKRRYVLIVNEDYQSLTRDDPTPAKDTLFLRIKGLNLKNSGSSIRLLNAQSLLVSRYFGHFDMSAKKNEGLAIHRNLVERCDIAKNWQINDPSPGK